MISELTRQSPDDGVVTFVSEPHQLWISVVTLHELEFGIQLMPLGRRRDAIAGTVNEFADIYQDWVIPLETAEVRQAAMLRAEAQRAGRTVALGDALIAGTAYARNLAVVTRNTSDFEGMGVELVNPWAG